MDNQEVKRWIQGQHEAQRVIDRERVHHLQNLTPEESLRIYLELKADAPDDPNRMNLSPVLMAMRQAAKKLAGKKESRDESV